MACNCSGQRCACNFEVLDTPTVDLTLTGSGSGADPWVLTADVIPESVGPYTLFSTGDAVANVGGGLVVLATTVVPANTLNVDGDRLKFRAVFTLNTFLFDFNGFTFEYGGVQFFAKPTTSGVDGAAIVEGEIIRTAPTDQKASTSGIISDNLGFGTFAGQEDVLIEAPLLGVDNAVANSFTVTGDSSGAATQTTLESLTLDFFPI